VFYAAALLLFLASPFGELFVDFDYGSFDDTPSVLPSYDFNDDPVASGAGKAGGASSSASNGGNGAPQNWTYRGFELRRGSDGHVYAPSLGRYFSSGREAHFTINAQAFQSETGLYDRTLMQIYMNADSDRNGHLSWREVAEFQRNTYRTYAYRYNNTALDPSDFLREGGGDCEDFALYTCGMLRFWGWNCKVAGFYPPGGGYGHAIAMVWSAAPINGYGYIRIDKGREVGNTYMQAGYWIPIDYDSIGDYSSAMGDDWELWNLDDPEDLYGTYL
jgi:transglutaminase-like putative cysteine protease